MIFDSIINVFIAPVKAILNLIPSIDVSIPADTFMSIIEYIQLAGYILPLGTITLLLGLKLSLWMAHIIIAIVVRAKSFIPFMGS